MTNDDKKRRSPMQDFPYDVLAEIFWFSLPHRPLDKVQPNFDQGPMHLSRVCSHWRSVAFSAHKLWTYLYFVMHVNEEKVSEGGDVVNRVVIRSCDLQFLKWWKEKVGNHSGLWLRLAVDPSYLGPTTYIFIHLDEFLVNFITSAHYLDLDHHLSSALHEYEGGKNMLDCPNLDTLIMRQGLKRPHRYIIREDFFHGQGGIETGYDTQTLFPFSSNSRIQRLYVEEMSITNVNCSIPWSNITHIVTTSLHLSLNTWFALIRGCINLVSASLEITINSEVDSYINPREVTLPYLQQIAIVTYGNLINTSLFLNLHLPGLISFRIDNFPWLTVQHLHFILSSTPNLRELHLGPDHPWSETTMGIQIPASLTLGVVQIAPLYEILPNLELLYFSGSEVRVDFLSCMVKDAIKSPWLGLIRPENRIKLIEFSTDPSPKLPARLKKVRECISQVEEQEGIRLEGVNLTVRGPDKPYVWNRRGSKYRNGSLWSCFDELYFEVNRSAST